MLIRLGYDIQFDIPAPAPIVTLLHVHPSRDKDLIEPDALHIEPHVDATEYIDGFGNRCTRFVAPQGRLRLHNSTLIRDTGLQDQINIYAREVPVGDVPTEFLCYLLSSRYCEVDRFSNIAYELFGHITPGLVARAGHLRLGAWQGDVQLSARAADEVRARCLHRAHRRMPRLPASRHYLLPRHEHPRALRHWLSRRYRLASLWAYGFQRVV